MASKWFEGLSVQAQGFLIGSLLFRSKDYGALLPLLDKSDSEILSARAEAILALERGQRVKLLVAELKRLLQLSAHPWLLAVEPSWLVTLLRSETRAIQMASLHVLPKALKDELKSALQLDMESDAVTHCVALALKKSLESQLMPMRAIAFDPVLQVDQLLILTKQELELVIVEMGKSGTAGAMATVGVANVAHLLEKRSKAEQSAIVEALKNAKAISFLDDNEAKDFLTQVFEGTLSQREQFYNCGLRILSVILLNESISLRREIAQRLDYNQGQKLLSYVNSAKPSQVRLDLELFSRIIELAKARTIDERFAKCLLPHS